MLSGLSTIFINVKAMGSFARKTNGKSGKSFQSRCQEKYAFRGLPMGMKHDTL